MIRLPHPTPVMLAAAALLAACGGGADAPGTASTNTVAAAGQAAAAGTAGAARATALAAEAANARTDAFDAAAAPSLTAEAAHGKRLFEEETFGGNGRTCRTCHSSETGTISPADAQRRHAANPADPLFLADGSDDGAGHGTSRMQQDATVLVRIPLPPNVTLADDPNARSVVLRRGVPSTLNTPMLDPVLMTDGRQPDLLAQARGAIGDHAQASRRPTTDELSAIAAFQKTAEFYSSSTMLRYAMAGLRPQLPVGRSEAEQRGRRFFIDAPLQGDLKTGLCAGCHSGPMLNETNEFVPAPPFRRGGRFQSAGVSEINAAGNPVHEYVFTNPDGSTTRLVSPDPGRALITGDARSQETANAFKTPTLWGVARTAPYFHDNSAKSLEDVARHYALFFSLVSPLVLTAQDQADIVAYMRLLR